MSNYMWSEQRPPENDIKLNVRNKCSDLNIKRFIVKLYVIRTASTWKWYQTECTEQVLRSQYKTLHTKFKFILQNTRIYAYQVVSNKLRNLQEQRNIALWCSTTTHIHNIDPPEWLHYVILYELFFRENHHKPRFQCETIYYNKSHVYAETMSKLSVRTRYQYKSISTECRFILTNTHINWTETVQHTTKVKSIMK